MVLVPYRPINPDNPGSIWNDGIQLQHDTSWDDSTPGNWSNGGGIGGIGGGGIRGPRPGPGGRTSGIRSPRPNGGIRGPGVRNAGSGAGRNGGSGIQSIGPRGGSGIKSPNSAPGSPANNIVPFFRPRGPSRGIDGNKPGSPGSPGSPQAPKNNIVRFPKNGGSDPKNSGTRNPHKDTRDPYPEPKPPAPNNYKWPKNNTPASPWEKPKSNSPPPNPGIESPPLPEFPPNPFPPPVEVVPPSKPNGIPGTGNPGQSYNLKVSSYRPQLKGYESYSFSSGKIKWEYRAYYREGMYREAMEYTVVAPLKIVSRVHRDSGENQYFIEQTVSVTYTLEDANKKSVTINYYSVSYRVPKFGNDTWRDYEIWGVFTESTAPNFSINISPSYPNKKPDFQQKNNQQQDEEDMKCCNHDDIRWMFRSLQQTIDVEVTESTRLPTGDLVAITKPEVHRVFALPGTEVAVKRQFKIISDLKKNLIGAFNQARRAKMLARIMQLLNITDVFLNFHNAAMLSADIGETFFDAIFGTIDTAVKLVDDIPFIGSFFDADEFTGFDSKELITKQLEEVAKKVFGVKEWEELKAKFAAFNTMIRSANTVLMNLKDLRDTQGDLAQMAAERIAVVNNGLVRAGVLDENGDLMSEKVNRRSAFLDKLEKIEDSGVINTAQFFQGMAANALDVKQTKKELDESRADFQKSTQEAIAKLTGEASAAKSASQGASSTADDAKPTE